MIHGKIVSFTDRGAAVGERIAACLPDALMERYARTVDRSLDGTYLTRFAQQAMVDCSLLVFVGAAGIAVRTVAPYLAGKAFDPAVLVVDEGGKYVIPILSGHLGGANALAQRIAQMLGAAAVITTATDGRGVFAVDNWAKAHGCAVLDPSQIRHISGALLRCDTVGLRSAFPVDGLLPAGISLTRACDAGFAVGFDAAAMPFPHTLHLVPRIVHLGIGCRRGTAAETIRRVAETVLKEEKISMTAVKSVASIDIKKDEVGLCGFCGQESLPFQTYTAAQLQRAAGEFTSSAFVAQTVGVDNVCERAAILAAGDGGRLIRRKRAADGVTIALAQENWRVTF